MAALLTLGLSVHNASAAIIAFSANPTTNSTDFTSYLASQGAPINTNINFNSLPTGTLNPTAYTLSDGVTIISSTPGVNNQIVFGAGPGQSNTTSSPVSPGEGANPASNYLKIIGSAAPSTVIFNFSSPALGFGVFTTDFFNPNGANLIQLTAFSGANGTGTNLGSVVAAPFNFQSNNRYFFGLASSTGYDIGSVAFTSPASGVGDRLGIDAVIVSTPEPSTYAMMFIGLGMLVVAQRKKKKATA